MENILAYGVPYTLKLVTASQIIIEGACHLGNVIITGVGGGADAEVFDGVNALAEKKLDLAALDSTTFSTGAGQCHVMNKGIYVRVNNATTIVMITYCTPPKEKEEKKEE